MPTAWTIPWANLYGFSSRVFFYLPTFIKYGPSSCPCFSWYPLSSFTDLRLNQVVHMRFDLFAGLSFGLLFRPEEGGSTFLRFVGEQGVIFQKMVHVKLTGGRLSNWALQLLSLICNNNSSFRNFSRYFCSFSVILSKTHMFSFCLKRLGFLKPVIKRMT